MNTAQEWPYLILSPKLLWCLSLGSCADMAEVGERHVLATDVVSCPELALADATCPSSLDRRG